MSYQLLSIKLKITMLLLFFSISCHLSLTSQSTSDGVDIANLREYTNEFKGKSKKPRTFGKKIGVSKEMEEASLANFLQEFDVLPVAYANSMMTESETLPAGTLIIAMDNALQNGSDTQLRQAYGLAVRLLHAGVPLKWIINPNKSSRSGIDLSASARLRYPSTGSYATRNFRTGPIAIWPGFETQAQAVINSFGNGIRVYQLQNATVANVHSNLTHKPYVFVEDESTSIHTSILDAAGLSYGTHYEVGSMTTVTTNQCVTIITAPHNSSIGNAERTAMRSFVRSGGNFLAQCAAIRGFQGSTPRAFLNSGYVDNPGIGSFLYSNPQEPSAQFEGDIADEGGSQEDFGFSSAPPGGTRIVHDNQNNYKAYTGRMDGVTASEGGYVHYLAGHDHNGNINADRYYLNAVLRSAERPSQCGLDICSVFPSVGGTVSPASQTICSSNGGAVPVTHTLSGMFGTVVRWEFRPPGGAWTNWGGAGSMTAPNNCCFTTPGTWNVRAIIRNGNCSAVASSVASINVNVSPSAPIIASIAQPTCTSPTGIAFLSGLPSGNYTITLNTGFSVAGNTPTFNFGGLNSNNTYTFTVTNASGCPSSPSTNAVINAIPGAPTLGGTTSVCTGGTATVTSNTGGTWQSSNTSVATVNNAGVVTGLASGFVSLTFTDNVTSCQATIGFTVIGPEIAGNIVGPDLVCRGVEFGAGTFQLTNVNGTIHEWLYSDNGGASWNSWGNGGQTWAPAGTVFNATLLIVAVVHNNGCWYWSPVKTVTSIGPEIAGNIVGPDVVCQGVPFAAGTFQLTNVNGTIHEWLYSDNGGASWNSWGYAGQTWAPPGTVFGTLLIVAVVHNNGCWYWSPVKTVNSEAATPGYIVGPSEVCMPFGWTGGVWTLNGQSGTPMWQFSYDNVNWTDWGVSGNSPGGSIANGPFYIRVRVTSGLGCESYTPTVTVTGINPPPLSVNSATICQGQSVTLSQSGFNGYVGAYELSRFANAIDPRGWVGSSNYSDIQITQGITHHPGINYFYMQRVSGNFAFVDYVLSLPAQNLGPYSHLAVNHNGFGSAQYEIWIFDGSQGYTNIGNSGGPTSGNNIFGLPSDYGLKDEVTQVLIRVYADYIGGIGATAAMHLGSITALSYGFSWNTGDTNGSISVSPSSTTTYTATAWYGGCTTSASGTVTVIGTEIAGNIVGPDVWCQGESNAFAPGTFQLQNWNGTIHEWQFSTDNVNWNSWGYAGQSWAPGGWLAGPVLYIRAVVHNSGCWFTSPVKTIIGDAQSVGGTVSPASQTICASQGGVLPVIPTVSGITGTVVRWEFMFPGGGWTDWGGAGSTTAPGNCCFTQIGTSKVRAIIKNGVCGEVASSETEIIVVGDPTPGYIVGPTEVCMPFGWTGGVWTINGHNGTPMWQYSSDNVNWVDWGVSGNSPGGTISNGPFYIRVRVTSGSGCLSYTPTITVTGINPPALSVSVNPGTICQGGAATLTQSGFNGWVGAYELSRYNLGYPDPRSGVYTTNPADIQITQGLTYDPNNINYFYVQRLSGNFAYVDYHLNLPAQNLGPYTHLAINHFGYGSAQYEVYIHDGSQGYSNIGNSGGFTSGANYFNLPSDYGLKDEVTQILIRVYADWIGGVGASTAMHLGSITALSYGFSWNTGDTNGSISVSPSSTTTYTATAWYGGCTTSATGTVTVLGPEIAGNIVGPDVWCQGAGFGAGTWQLTNYNGTIHGWEYSDNGGASWNDWGNGGQTWAPAGTIVNSTLLIRALVHNSGCWYHTPVKTITSEQPTPGYIVGPTEVCMPFGWTGGVWSVNGNTGTPFWQYSADNVNWVDWGAGTNSPGGTISNGPFYIRVQVSSGLGCVAFTPTITVTGINPPALSVSVNPGTICQGGAATLTQSGFNGWVGSYELSRFQPSVDPRGSIYASGGGIQITEGPLHYQNINYFRVQNVNGNGDYVDYNLVLPAQNLGPYNNLAIDHAGYASVRYQIWIHDQGHGWSLLGITPGVISDIYYVALPSDYSNKDQVDRILIRVYNEYVGGVGTIATWHASRIQALSYGFSWNTGQVAGEITVSPSSTTNYTFTANYGGCTTSATGTVYVWPQSVGGTLSPASQTICVGQGGTIPVVPTLSGHTGDVLIWQYLPPGGGWTDWGGGGSTTAPNNCCFNAEGTWKIRAIVKSGICDAVVSSESEIIVAPNPAPGLIVGPSQVCVPLASTLGVWSIMGHNGTTLWQWSYDNVNWTDWGGGDRSNVGSIGASPFYIRVRVTSGSGCVAYTPTHTVTAITPPALSVSVNPATICQGQSATLSQSGFDGGVGAYTISRYNLGYPDPRTGVASSNPSDIQITLGLTYDPVNINYFYVQRLSSNASAFVDYDLYLPSQNLGSYTALAINHFGYGSAQYDVYIKDASQGYTLLGNSGGPTSGENYFSLPANVGLKDEITEIKIRIYAGWIGGEGATNAMHLGSIAAIASSFSWNNGDTNGSITVSPSSTTTYTATANYGGCTTSATGTVNVNALPSAPVITSINQPTCANPTGTANLSGLPSGNYTLTLNNGFSVVTSGPTFNFGGLSSNTTYTLTVTNASGCISPQSANIVIDAIPGAPTLGGTTSVCVGSTANVTSSSGGTWQSSNTSVATVDNAGVVTGIAPGNVNLTFTDGATGCNATIGFTVNAIPTAGFIVGPTEVCMPLASTAGVWTIAGHTGTPFWYYSSDNVNWVEWGAGNISPAGNIASGPFYIRVRLSSAGCVVYTPTLTVSNITPPSLSVSVDPGTICQGQSATLSQSGFDGNVGSYEISRFQSSVDPRGIAYASGGGIQITEGPAHTQNINYFRVQNLNGNADYVDYQLILPQQNLGTYQQLVVDHAGFATVKYQIFINDQDQGWSLLGTTSGITTGTSWTALPSDYSRKDQVTAILIRVYNEYIGGVGTIATWHASSIKAHSVGFSWNNGDPNFSITVSPSSTTTYTATANYGGCTTSATGTVNVTPDNTAATVATTNLCIGTAISRTQATTGATGIGTATGLPAGVTAIWAANTITFSGSPTASGTFSYSIPLTGGCGTVNATGTITVIENNTAANVPESTLCIGTALTRIQATTGATGIGTPTGLPVGVTVSWASNTITFSGSPTTAGTFNYSIPLTGGCGTVNATGTITVNDNNTVATVPETTLCIGTAITRTQATTGATGIGTAILPTGVTATWASNIITFSGIPTAAGTFNYAKRTERLYCSGDGNQRCLWHALAYGPQCIAEKHQNGRYSFLFT